MKNFERIYITPSRAKEILSSTRTNRTLNENRVKSYADQMKRGMWMADTGETIKIDWNGNLIDGQHRLNAVIKSGQSVWMDLKKDVNPDAMKVIDTGKTRTSRDVFQISGISYGSQIPAIISRYHLLMQGRTDAELKLKLTNAELLDKYYENPEKWFDITQKSDKWYKNFGKTISASIIGGTYAYLLEYTTKEKATVFFNQFCSGELIQNSTIILLRNTLIKELTSIRRMPLNHKIALIIKTMKAYLSDKQLKGLKYDSQKETFPKL